MSPFQVDGVFEHPVCNARTQSGFGGDVNVASEQIAEIHEKGTEVEKAAAFFKVDEEVEVAVLGYFASCDGSEDPYVWSSVIARHLLDFSAASPEGVKRRHRHGSRIDGRSGDSGSGWGSQEGVECRCCSPLHGRVPMVFSSPLALVRRS